MKHNYAIALAMILFLLACGCGKRDNPCHPGSDGLRVTAVVPLNNAAGVAINTKITATFNAVMDPATLTTETFILRDGETAVSGIVTCSGATAVFTPADNLVAGTTYNATITTGAKCHLGNALASPHVWSFTTGAAADTTAPTVTAVVPHNNATGVATNTKTSATFSEAMDPATLNTATFTLLRGSTPVSGNVTCTGATAVFTPSSENFAGATYTATITTGAKDLAGNPLASDYVWSFTTGEGPDITAPTVTAVDPHNNATGVAINKKISATFSEAMDPVTITAATFMLRQGATVVSGIVTYNGVTAVFTPAGNLASSTTYTATITTGAEDLAGNPLASDYVWSFTTGAAPDTTAPTVTSVDPQYGATGVSINKKISATFSEAMDPATISTATFTLKQGATPVSGNVTYNGVTAVFTPSSYLASSTTYTATIKTGAEDLAGNPLASAYVWSFTTGAAADTTAPTVTSVDPHNGATGVSFNKKISATFSEAMDPGTISTATFTLKQGVMLVAGNVTYNGVTAIFTPSGDLAASTTYTATITTGAEDLAGNPLASDYVWSFTTGVTPDTTIPTVVYVDPQNHATDVPINQKISATFSEHMDPATISNVTFTLKQGSTTVSGNVTYNGLTAVLTPSSNLAASTLYTATITTGAEDLAGNALASDYVWSFTTGAAADTTAPTVTSVDPQNGATGVAINKKISATFSEAMDPGTISTATFTLKQGVMLVAGNVTYNGVTALFTPSGDLAASTTYTATITTGAEDLSGNPLASDYVWSFTTGVTPDTTIPTVVYVDPQNGATDVPINKKISATFSEHMDPATISNATFSLKQGSTTVSGNVTYNGLTAVFTPSGNLAPNTLYTATITTGAEDLAGNPMASDYVWSFTTGEAPDTTAPTVTAVTPLNNATGVCLNTKVSATFSEAMDPATISTATFTVKQGATAVSGNVIYSGLTAVFTPSSNLAPTTLYTATITTGARDLAGNPLASAYIWSFTTGTTICTEPIDLGAAGPFGGFGGGAGMTNQGIYTIINGDIGTTGASTLITGFHDSVGDIYTETPLNVGTVNGRIYTAPPSPGGAGVGGTAETYAIAAAAANATLILYNSISPASLPGGVDPGAGQLGGLTLAPGIYKAAGGTFLLTGSDLTLDGQGDPNAVWVFQCEAGLTVGAPGFPRSVILTNGAHPRNIFWYVGSAARIEDCCNMVGTIVAYSGVTISTHDQMCLTTLDGRAMGLNASVTVVNTIINIPE